MASCPPPRAARVTTGVLRALAAVEAAVAVAAAVAACPPPRVARLITGGLRAVAAAALAWAWDKRTTRRAAPPWLLLGNFRLIGAMVNGIGENDILCEL